MVPATLAEVAGGLLRVLGIDPGSRFTGYGVVDQEKGRLLHVGHGIIRANPKMRLEFRLHEIFLQLSAVVKMYQPHAVAVEGLFFFRNAKSALTLGQARAIALLVAAQKGLPVFEYSPARVKKSVGAGGAAGKDAVARMVCTFLGTPARDRADATDALAIAICHLNQNRSQFAKPATWSMKQAPRISNSGRVKLKSFRPLADRLTSAYRYCGGGK